MSLRDYLFYEESGITLYCGDSRKILPDLLGPFQCTSYCFEECSSRCVLGPVVILADPPYGISIVSGSAVGGAKPFGTIGGPVIAPTNTYMPVFGDDGPFDPSWLLKLSVPTILWGANHYADRLPSSPTWLVWDKRTRDYSNNFADCELAWTNLGGPARMFRHERNGLMRESERDRRVHPTQKPVQLYEWILNELIPPSALVVDPYMGSGPSLEAAKLLGRRAIGIEIEPKYCEIAVKRLRQEVLTFPT